VIERGCFNGNPILEPRDNVPWESKGVFNAAAIEINKKIIILYRAVGSDNVSRIGYASTLDGYHINERLPMPIFEPSNDAEKNGCEDPRLTIIGDKIIMAYTAYGYYNEPDIYQIALTSINLSAFQEKQWTWSERTLAFPGVRNKDAVVFPKKINNRYVMFHRLDPDICVAYSSDLHVWSDVRSVMKPRLQNWDCWKIGAAGQPIELTEGWLFIYHGVNSEKVYSLGVALLERDNPEVVLYRSEKPILRPVAKYECVGNVPNVVFSCGNVLKDDQVLVYYGGADKVLCVATYDLSDLLPKK